MSGTSVYNRIAIHETAETSLPTAASAGSNIAKSAWTTAGFETIFSVDFRTDNYDVDEDEFSLFDIEPIHVNIRPPYSTGIHDIIPVSTEVGAAEIKLYDMREGVFTLASNITVSSNVAKIGTSYTFRTVAIEVYGKGVIHVPKALVLMKNITGGFGDEQVARATMTIQPIDVSGTPGGVQIEYYV